MKSWTDRIAEAEARQAKGLRGFLRADRAASTQWLDCACGEQDPRIPRDYTGRPLDLCLVGLGADFAGAVEKDDIREAKYILGAIEWRARRILQEIVKTKYEGAMAELTWFQKVTELASEGQTAKEGKQ